VPTTSSRTRQTVKKRRPLKALVLDETGHEADEWGDLTPTLNQPRCLGRKADGKRCLAIKGRDGYCYQHSPNRTDAQKKQQNANRGRPAKLAKLQRLLPENLRSIWDLLLKSIFEVYDGSLPPARAMAISSLAGTAIRLVEASEIESRLRFLEQARAVDADAYAQDYADDDAEDA
jgi:hypothetical protein